MVIFDGEESDEENVELDFDEAVESKQLKIGVSSPKSFDMLKEDVDTVCSFRTESKECDRWIISSRLAHNSKTKFKDISLVCVDLSFIYSIVDGYFFPSTSVHVRSTSLGFLPTSLYVRTTCNGLLCGQQSFGCNGYYVCHPVTKEWKLISTPTICHGPEVAVALAIQPASYELVCAITSSDGHIYFEIYSSRTSSWRVSDTICHELNGLQLSGDGFYWKGTVYWKISSGSILAFDLKMNAGYQILPLPMRFSPNGTVTQMHGELCYVVPRVHNSQCTIKVYWIFEKTYRNFKIIPLRQTLLDTRMIITVRNRVFVYNLGEQLIELLNDTWADGYPRIVVNMDDIYSPYFLEESEFLKIFFLEVLPRANLNDVFRLSVVAKHFNNSIWNIIYKKVILNGTAAPMLFALCSVDEGDPNTIRFFANEHGKMLVQKQLLEYGDIPCGRVIGTCGDWVCMYHSKNSMMFTCSNTKTHDIIYVPAPLSYNEIEKAVSGFGFVRTDRDFRIVTLVWAYNQRLQFVFSLRDTRWISIKITLWRKDIPNDPPVYWKGSLYWYDLKWDNRLIVYNLERNQYYPLYRCEKVQSQGSCLCVFRNLLSIVDCLRTEVSIYSYREDSKSFQLQYKFAIKSVLKSVKPIFVNLDGSILFLLNNIQLGSFSLRKGFLELHPPQSNKCNAFPLHSQL